MSKKTKKPSIWNVARYEARIWIPTNPVEFQVKDAIHKAYLAGYRRAKREASK